MKKTIGFLKDILSLALLVGLISLPISVVFTSPTIDDSPVIKITAKIMETPIIGILNAVLCLLLMVVLAYYLAHRLNNISKSPK